MKLKVPKKAYRNNNKGKWHLPHRSYEFTASCGHCIRMTDKTLQSSYLKDLKVDNICKNCLGPCVPIE